MKFTMTSALVAALAAVSSAAAIGSTAVETPLPAKFTLKSSALTRGTAIEKFLGQVTVDEYASQYLNIGPGNGQPQVPVTIFKNGDSGAYVGNTDSLGNWDLSISPGGNVRFWAGSHSPQFTVGVAFTGYTQVNGAFAFNAADGKGPQTLWVACPDVSGFSNAWIVSWGTTTTKGCIPISLKVVPV